MDEKITGYHVFFVIFTFFLLTGFIIGISISYGTSSDFTGMLSDDIIINHSFRIFNNSPDTDETGILSDKAALTDLLSAFAKAFVLDFRYLFAIFLCGFTAFAPVFGIFILFLRGAVFGHSLSAIYRLICSGYLFAPYGKLAFFCYFISGAVNIVLCLNTCCITNIFSSVLRKGVPLKRLFMPDNTVTFSAGRYTVIFLLLNFIQLCITALRCFLIGLLP